MTIDPFFVGSLSEEFVPRLQPDATLRHYEQEAVVWGSFRAEPVLLDRVAAVITQIIDGTASVADLADDVTAVLDVPRDVASAHIAGVIGQLQMSGVLSSSAPRPEADPDDLDLFCQPPSP